MQKGITSAITIIAIVILMFAGAIGLFVLFPKYQADQYKIKAQPILQNIETEFVSFKKDNYNARKNIKLQIDDAKAALATHLIDFKNTQEDIANLRNEYDQIPKPSRSKSIDVSFIMLFDDLNSLFSNYNQDLDFRKGQFAAFGTLQEELDVFQKMFYQGGSRADFIVETDKISQLSQQTIYALKNLEVPDYDQDEYAYRIVLVSDINKTFDSLNEDYRLGNDIKLSEDISGLTARSIQRTKDFETIVEKFYADSVIATKVKKVEDDISQVKQKFINEPKSNLPF